MRGGILLRYSCGNSLNNIKEFTLQLLNINSTYNKSIVLPSATTDTVELKIPYSELQEMAQTTSDSILDLEICLYDDIGSEYCTSTQFSLEGNSNIEVLYIKNNGGWYAINFDLIQ